MWKYVMSFAQFHMQKAFRHHESIGWQLRSLTKLNGVLILAANILQLSQRSFTDTWS